MLILYLSLEQIYAIGKKIITSTLYTIIVKKLNSLKHLVRTTVAESHN